MNKLDDKNIRVFWRIHSLGKLIWVITQKIKRQKEEQQKAKKEFRELLLSYPKARDAYYHEE